jgi:hypothetical protein
MGNAEVIPSVLNAITISEDVGCTFTTGTVGALEGPSFAVLIKADTLDVDAPTELFA